MKEFDLIFTHIKSIDTLTKKINVRNREYSPIYRKELLELLIKVEDKVLNMERTYTQGK